MSNNINALIESMRVRGYMHTDYKEPRTLFVKVGGSPEESEVLLAANSLLFRKKNGFLDFLLGENRERKFHFDITTHTVYIWHDKTRENVLSCCGEYNTGLIIPSYWEACDLNSFLQNIDTFCGMPKEQPSRTLGWFRGRGKAAREIRLGD